MYRMCKRKRRYSDEYEAQRTGKSRSMKIGVILRVYECPFCGGYHLTSKIARRMQDVA